MTERQRIVGLISAVGLLWALGVLVLTLPLIKAAADAWGRDWDLRRRENLVRSLALTSEREWTSIAGTGNCVLLLNCEWNIDVASYRQRFAEFAMNREVDDRVKVATVMLDADAQDEASRLAQQVVDGHGIAYGLKNLHGAGLVLWMKDGRLADHAWWVDVPTPEALRERTAMAFGNRGDTE